MNFLTQNDRCLHFILMFYFLGEREREREREREAEKRGLPK